MQSSITASHPPEEDGKGGGRGNEPEILSGHLMIDLVLLQGEANVYFVYT